MRVEAVSGGSDAMRVVVDYIQSTGSKLYKVGGGGWGGRQW